jgi:hypothetical protein
MNRRLTISACTLALAAATIVPGVRSISHASPALTSDPDPIKTLLHSVPTLVHDALDLGAINPLRRLQVVVPLALPDQTALDDFVTSEYTPGSPNYHRFIDPATFGARYGASAQRVGFVVQSLRSLGLDVASPSPNRLFVKASGPAALLQQIFGTTIHNFRLGNGLRFFANIADLKLPSALVGAVTSVIGLDNSTRPYPALRRATTHPYAASDAPAIGPVGQHGGATPCAAAIAGVGYTAPQLATGYNFNGLYAKGLLGQGMTAALVEFDDFHDSNVAGLESCYGLHIPVQRHVVGGGSGGSPRGAEAEDMADITTILEMLPKLKRLDVYVAPITNLGEIDLYNKFATDHSAPVLSSSWGNCEQLESAADNRLFASITEEAAAQGQQIFQAAGDSGAVGCRGFPEPTLGSISAMQEAGVPWVTGVGGTDLGQATANGLSATRHEATWNDDGAGGGGVSTMWPMPAWQAALKSARTAPGRSGKVCGATNGALCREIPDISANADSGLGLLGRGGPQFTDDLGSAGYSVYCATPNCALLDQLGLPLPPLPIGLGGVAGWEPIGGTSLAAPLVAAAAVLWDEQARKAHLTGYGLLNPSLYADAHSPTRYARDFHDITSDSNSDQYDAADCPSGCNPRHLYQARKGYDMATGLGSIDATALGTDLVKQAKRIALSNDRVHVYGYRGGVATTAPVVASTGLRHASYTAHSNARWLHVTKSGKAPGKLRWSASPRGLSLGTRTGTITLASHGHRVKLTVVYAVSKPAKLHLSSSHLVFREAALDFNGKPTVATCGSTLWDDELFDPVNGTTGTKVSKNSKKVLRISNRGPKKSVLHWQAFPFSFASTWLGVDLTHGKTQTGQSRPLVPTDGADRNGRTSLLRLASTANVNALGGFPMMNQGTYHGVIQIRDLADPRHLKRVPATLILGNGKKTPTIRATAAKRITVKHGHVATLAVKLSDASHGCGYDYSLSSSAGWATPNRDDYSGTVAPTGSGSVGGSDTGAGTGTIAVGISAKHLKAGVHPLTLTIQSQDAEPNPTLLHIKVKVTK